MRALFPRAKPVPASEAASGTSGASREGRRARVTESTGLSAEFSRSEN
jgi:hypothetical protein